MASGPTAEQQQQQQQQEEEESEPESELEDVKTEGLQRSRKAVLPSEIRRRERSTEDPQRGRVEEELGTSRGQSQTQDAAVEESARGRVTGRALREGTEHTSHLQTAGGRSREQENAIYIHKELTATHIQPRVSHTGPGSSTFRTALVLDAEDPQGLNPRCLQHQTRSLGEGEVVGSRESQLDSRVSVAQLRHTYMESASTTHSSCRNEL